ncbi:hypothetical protein QP027_03500 [Corynebacterium breve]|uniref:Uncharacterized protein n=1 Tax=Corynebacterium breve TaxID=3049799 RepID=A0ABY8VG52_9CORY|nr:hypothetical protein [Corynebacterium breve]WIM68474.1 hypothetical protein QP027_03500 [Corynebacterium breve]
MNLSTHVSLIGADKYSGVERGIPSLCDEDEATAAKQILFRLASFTNVEPFDAALAALQDPEARFLRTRDEWADVGGWPLIDVTPVALMGPDGTLQLYYSEKEVRPIGEAKTLSEFKAGKDVGIQGTREFLDRMILGAQHLTTEIVMETEPSGTVEFPGGAVRAVEPRITEVKDELDAQRADRPISFELALSTQLNRRETLESAIRGFATVILGFPNPWRCLTSQDIIQVERFVTEAFAGRVVYRKDAATAWSMLRDQPLIPLIDEPTAFEINLAVWGTKRRIGARIGKWDREIEAFIADKTALAPQGVSFPRVLRAQTFIERALFHRSINPDLVFTAGLGKDILAMLSAER